MDSDVLKSTKPELKWLPISELYIPHKYQRTLEGRASLRNIEEIQRNFNWAEFNTLLVCKLKKDSVNYAVIDGQHRLRAAQLMDIIKEVPCVIIAPRDVKQQAQTFININSRRLSLTSLAFYRASLAAGDPTAEKIDRICAQTGVVIPTYATLLTSTPPNVFSSTGYLMQLLRATTYREDQVVWAFKVILASYAETPGALRFSLVRALMEWCKQSPEVSVEDMTAMLLMTEIQQMDTMARELQISGGKSMWKAYLTILDKLYASFAKKKKKSA